MKSLTRLNHTTVALLLTIAASLTPASASAQDMLISGVVDGPLPGGLPKAVEIYVVNDVSDLSRWGVSSANNGAGPTGSPEFVFGGGSAAAGTYLYVASDADSFLQFFGIAADAISGAANVNGDDAIELFENGAVVDVFGDVSVDGSSEPWEYLDGWAYRVSDTGPDGSVFSLSSWTFSGPNALDGETNNATAAQPFPIASFAQAAGDAAPRVVATSPVAGDNTVAVAANVSLTFSEPVAVADGAFDLSCEVSGARSFTVSSADNVVFDLVVDGEFEPAERCNVTVFGALVSDIDTDDPPDTMAADFVLDFGVASPLQNGVVINEINADPDTTLGDSNGDGVANFGEDEFVEIVNTTGQPLDVSGWLLADGFDTRHVFPAGSVIADGCALVVFGGGEPTGAFGGALVQTASSGSLGLNNGGDTVTLNTGATDAARVEYGGEGGANQSLTRSPDISGDFAQHLSVSAARFSPGTAADGSTFAGCDAPVQVVTIAQVQGSGASSPFAGQNVVVEGVVTGDLQDSDADEQNSIRGFYVQSAVADSDPETSEGIYVFDGPSPAVDVAVGDIVRVSGAATEFFGETQISASSVEIIGSGGSIAPVTVTLPVANVVLGDDGEYIADLERYEGMLVTITTPLTVTDVFNLDRFGELLLVAGERPLQFTNTNAPDAAGLDAYLQALGARSIMLDDGLTVQNPDPIRYPAPGLPNATDDSVRTGDGVLGVTGNVRFSRGSGGSGDALYRIMPTVEPVFVNNNPRQQTPPPVGGSLRVVSANVLNYFTTIDLPGATCGPSLIGCRGADSDIEFERQQQKLVTQLLALDADVIGLIEVENNPQESLASLVDAMNAALGETQYAFLDTGTIGGDAIKVGFVYRAAKVAPTGPFAVLDSSVDPRFIDNRNRPVLAQTFREIATAGTLTIAVNHLKSKGSSCDDTGDFDLGDGQGNCNLTRTLAAQATVDWLATDPTGSGDADILVIGDFNAYLLEDPINAYRDAGYTNLLDDLAPEDAYTLNFDRQSGALDHAIATASMLPQIAGVSIWHINTDEADAIDYNLNFGRNPDIFNGTLAQRGSDHDPVLVGLSLVGDLDGDGVNNADDVCPATAIPEAAPTSGQLRKYRWALVDADNIFDTPKDSGLSFTTQDTAGCSCTQIVERLSLAAGQLRQGCTTRVLQKWIGQLD